MLVLSRRLNESFVLPGLGVRVEAAGSSWPTGLRSSTTPAGPNCSGCTAASWAPAASRTI